jgi:hypothetical protein
LAGIVTVIGSLAAGLESDETDCMKSDETDCMKSDETDCMESPPDPHYRHGSVSDRAIEMD